MNTNSNLHPGYDKQVAIWLIVIAGIIFCMIILGGVTRLTHSGLSMVDWNPIMGIIPPINDADWLRAFARYQEFPEYQKINQGMSVEQFKSIFYFEYFHRILGRLIGILFLIPFLYFWFRSFIRKSLLPQMAIMFFLGGCQGLLGWYMVKSGLINDPHVSQYRLTAHLISAVIIYCYILWVAFGLLTTNTERTTDQHSQKLFSISKILTLLIILMIITGGLVAGTRAGFVYNTFPLMNGKLIPDAMYTLHPLWLNWLENVTAIQFNHRVFAYGLLFLISSYCFAVYKYGTTARSRHAAILLLILLIAQVCLGVATILLHVPVLIASCHQGGAILLLTTILFITRELKPEK